MSAPIDTSKARETLNSRARIGLVFDALRELLDAIDAAQKSPVVDLNALAARVERLEIDAIEAEMPRIRRVERRTADLEAVAWVLGIPKKPAEPEQMICENAGTLGHVHDVSCHYISISEWNRRQDAEANMEPEPGDMVRQEGWENSFRVVSAAGGGMWSLNAHGTYSSWDMPREGKWIISRPPLVPGEGVMHREHPEWGVGTIIDGGAWFPTQERERGPCFVKDLSRLRRVAYMPHLHGDK